MCENYDGIGQLIKLQTNKHSISKIVLNVLILIWADYLIISKL